MSVGSLNATVVPNHPLGLHCGPDDPVRGNVRVRYVPPHKQPDSELFGPLKISITVYGRLKTKLKPGKETFRERVPLFQRKLEVYNGPIRIKQGEIRDYPFGFIFPQRLDNPSHLYTIWDGRDLNFNLEAGQPLPPSMSFAHMGFNTSGEAHVEYKISASLLMPSIDVSTTDANEVSIQYERPRMRTPVPDIPRVSRGIFAFKDKRLIPKEDRPNPQGFKQRTSSLFQVVHRPFCKLRWTLTTPTHLHRYQPLMLQLRLKPQEEDCTAPVLPELKLIDVAVRVYACVVARTQTHFFNEPHYWGEDNAAGYVLRCDVPFTERNHWTRLVAVDYVTNIPSSVRTICINQSYRIKIEARVSIAGRIETMKGRHPITIHPPLAEEQHVVVQESPSPLEQVTLQVEDPTGLPPYKPGDAPPGFSHIYPQRSSEVGLSPH